MGKERRLLRDVADAALLWRHPNALTRVEERDVADDDPTDRVAAQSGDDFEERGLARSGGPQDRGDLAAQCRRYFERERVERQPDAEVDHREALSRRRGPKSSDAYTAARAMSDVNPTRRSASGSCPVCDR